MISIAIIVFLAIYGLLSLVIDVNNKVNKWLKKN